MIYTKLQQARVDLQNKKIKKSGKNQYYSYYELGDFLPAINEILHGLKVHSIFNITREKAVLRLIDTEDNTEELFETPFIKAELKGCTAIQSLGASITYLKRYLYMNAFEIVENDYTEIQTDLSNDKPAALSDEIKIKTLRNCKTIQSLNAVVKKYKDTVANPQEFQKVYMEMVKSIKGESNNAESGN